MKNPATTMYGARLLLPQLFCSPGLWCPSQSAAWLGLRGARGMLGKGAAHQSPVSSPSPPGGEAPPDWTQQPSSPPVAPCSPVLCTGSAPTSRWPCLSDFSNLMVCLHLSENQCFWNQKLGTLTKKWPLNCQDKHKFSQAFNPHTDKGEQNLYNTQEHLMPLRKSAWTLSSIHELSPKYMELRSSDEGNKEAS